MRKTNKFFILVLVILIISSLIMLPVSGSAAVSVQTGAAGETAEEPNDGGAPYPSVPTRYYSSAIKADASEEIYKPCTTKITSYEELTALCPAETAADYSGISFDGTYLLVVEWNEPCATRTLEVSGKRFGDDAVTVEMTYTAAEEDSPTVITPYFAVIPLSRDYADMPVEVKLLNMPQQEPAVPEIYWDGRIEIVPPQKTVYTAGEYLDLTGMEIYGLSGIRYSDGTEEITKREALSDVSVDLSNRALTVYDTSVTVSGCYSVTGSARLSGSFDITVDPKATDEPPNPLAPPAFLSESITYISNAACTESMRFLSMEDFAAFVEKNVADLNFSWGIYNDYFFEDKILMLLYIKSDSSSSSFETTSVDFNGQGADFEVTQRTYGATDDIVSWYLLCECDKSYAESEMNITLCEDMSYYAENAEYYRSASGGSYDKADIRKITSADELGAWTELSGRYDESFFENSFLLTVGWTEPVYVRCHEISSMILKDNSVEIELKEFEYGGDYPEALSGNVAVIELPKIYADKEYAAVFNNVIWLNTAEQLAAFRDDVNNGNDFEGKTVCLGANIDLSSVCGRNVNGEKVSWKPIGANDNGADSACGVGIKPNIFNGTFDGLENTVNRLYIDSVESEYNGLFGFLGDKAVVKNLTVDGYVGAAVESNMVCYAGGIAGYSVGMIENCHNKAYVNVSKNTFVGGIAGDNNGTVSKCINSGTIETDDYFAGGICGRGGTIENCLNKGMVKGQMFIGGICAQLIYGSVKNSCNTGSVIGKECNGGIIGDAIVGSVENSYYLNGISDPDDYNGTPKSFEQFKSGEVAYLLGEEWGQKIGAESYPSLGGARVYLVDGVYTNDPLQEKTYPYEITGLSFTDTAGNKLVPEENKSFIVEADIKKTAERSEKDYLFVAVYDTDGALLSLDYVKADLTMGHDYSFGFNIPAQSRKIGLIKAYVWNSFGSMEPLAETKEDSFVTIYN